MNTTLPKQDLSVFKHSFPQETEVDVLGRFLIGVYISLVTTWIIHLAKCILNQWIFFLLLIWQGWSVKNAVLMIILNMLDQKIDFSDILPRKSNSPHHSKTKTLFHGHSTRNKVNCHTYKDQQAISSLKQVTKEKQHLHKSKNHGHSQASQTMLEKPTIPARETHQAASQASEEIKSDSTEDLLRQLEALEKRKEPTMSEIDAMYYQGIVPPRWTLKPDVDCNHHLASAHQIQSLPSLFDRIPLLKVQEPTHTTNHFDQRQDSPYVYPSSSFGFKKCCECREDEASNHTSTRAVIEGNDTVQKQGQRVSSKDLESQHIRQTNILFQQPLMYEQPIPPLKKKSVSIPSRYKKPTRFTLPPKRQKEQHLERVKNPMKASLDEKAYILSSDNTKNTSITLKSGNMTENLSIDSIKQVLAEKVFDHNQDKVNIVCTALEASLAQRNKSASIKESDQSSTKVNEKSIFASQESFVSTLPDSNLTTLHKKQIDVTNQ